jgi:hypothetical protein
MYPRFPSSFICEKKLAALDCGVFRGTKITNDVRAMRHEVDSRAL